MKKPEVSNYIFSFTNFVINRYYKFTNVKGNDRYHLDLFDQNLNYLTTYVNDRSNSYPHEQLCSNAAEGNFIYYLTVDAENERNVFGKYIIKNSDQ